MPDLTPEGRAAVRDAQVGWLSTSRADGSPHLTPVWFVFDDDTVWIATARRAVKVRNIEREPRVALAVDGSATKGGLVAEGVAAVRDLHVPAVLRAFAAKYDGWDVSDAGQDGDRVLVRLDVRRWLLAQ